MNSAFLFRTSLLTGLALCVCASVAGAAEKETGVIQTAVFEEAPAASSAAVPAAQAVTSVALTDFKKAGEAAVDVNSLMKTVNETLTENRDLKKNMTAVQESFERLTIENNVLKSRLRSLERRSSEKDEEKKAVQDEVRRRQQQIDSLRSQNEKQMDRLLEQGKKLQDAGIEIEALEKKLDEAILETERDAYNRRIEDLRGEADQAVAELARANTLRVKMQEELGENYYRMGNILFGQRDFAKAIEYYLKALEFNPQLSYAHHNLGIIYDFYLSDNPAALAHYRKFLKLDPQDTSADQIRERMLELELIKNVVPDMPLKLDFNEFHKKSN